MKGAADVVLHLCSWKRLLVFAKVSWGLGKKWSAEVFLNRQGK